MTAPGDFGLRKMGEGREAGVRSSSRATQRLRLAAVAVLALLLILLACEVAQ